MKIYIITRDGVPYRAYEKKEKAADKILELREFKSKHGDVVYEITKLEVR